MGGSHTDPTILNMKPSDVILVQGKNDFNKIN